LPIVDFTGARRRIGDKGLLRQQNVTGAGVKTAGELLLLAPLERKNGW
jgi:hypothetical protein